MIVLIQPPTMVKGKEPTVPFSLLKIAALPDKEGYEVKILDGSVLKIKQIQRKIKIYDPEFVGFTTFTGPILKYCLKLSQFVKENTSAKVIWGGVHASLLPHQVIREKCVDIVTIGESDYTLLEILKNKNSLEKVKGIVFKRGKKIITTLPRPFIELDKLPLTPWHLINVKKYLKRNADAKKTLPLSTSRGCPFMCTFCYNKEFNKGVWRPLSVEKVKEEIDQITSNYSVDGIRFYDENFIGLSPERAKKITTYVKKKDLKFSCLLRTDQVNEKILRKFKSDGCNFIFYGIESGSERILRFLRKYIPLQLTRRIIETTRKLGIRCQGGFIYDIPTETFSDVRMTFDLIKRLKIYVSLTPMQPLPGTEIYSYCVRNNLFHAPKNTSEWSALKIGKPHGLSQLPKNKIEKYGRWWDLQYNYSFNAQLAIKSRDFWMLNSMAEIFGREIFSFCQSKIMLL